MKNEILEIWWNKGNNVFSIRFYPQHWRLFSITNNGYRKGIDSCSDRNIHFLGIFISYTKFNCKKYDKKIY